MAVLRLSSDGFRSPSAMSARMCGSMTNFLWVSCPTWLTSRAIGMPFSTGGAALALSAAAAEDWAWAAAAARPNRQTTTPILKELILISR
jgi:hypothetical protein